MSSKTDLCSCLECGGQHCAPTEICPYSCQGHGDREIGGYGTDDGPACPACDGTIYSYVVEPLGWSDNYRVRSECVSCGRRDGFGGHFPGADEPHIAAIRQLHHRVLG